jgi:hypothetical protein
MARVGPWCHSVAVIVGAAALIVTGVPAVAAPVAVPVVGVEARPAAEFNGGVYALAYHAGVVYVGGAFTAALVDGHSVARQHLAAVDARTGALLRWAPAADGVVHGLAVDDLAVPATVYAVGTFTHVAGAHRDSAAALDAATGTVRSFRHTITGSVSAVTASAGRVYLAGRFSSVDGYARANVAAFVQDTGQLDQGWDAGTDGPVEALAVTTGRVYLAGRFAHTDGVPGTARLAAVRTDTGAADLGFRPDPPAVVHAVAATAAGVYAALGGQGGRGIGYDNAGRTRWTVTLDGDVQAIAVLGSVVYLGGHFDNACQSVRTRAHGVCVDGSIPRVKFAAATVDGSLLDWSPTGNGVHGVFALAADPGSATLVAGGEFTTVHGAPRRRFALFSR